MNQFILVGIIRKVYKLVENDDGIKILKFSVDSQRNYKESGGLCKSDKYNIYVYEKLALDISTIINKDTIVGIKGHISKDKKNQIILVGDKISILKNN